MREAVLLTAVILILATVAVAEYRRGTNNFVKEKTMSDMSVWLRESESGVQQTDEGDPCAFEYIRADRYAALEAENRRLEAENSSYEKREHAYIAQLESQENNDE